MLDKHERPESSVFRVRRVRTTFIALVTALIGIAGPMSATAQEPPEGAVVYYVDQEGKVSVTYGPGYRPDERALIPDDEMIPLTSDDGKVTLKVSADVYELLMKGGTVDYVLVAKSADGTEPAIRRYHCHGGICHSH